MSGNRNVLTKTDLSKQVSEQTGCSRAVSSECLDAALKIITESLGLGKAVRFIGFGSFVVNHRPARRGRNPVTGAVLEIKAAGVVRFRPGQFLKQAVSSVSLPSSGQV